MGNGQSSDQNKINQYLRERDQARGERDKARWERDQAQASGWRMDLSLVLLCSGLNFFGYIFSISSLVSHILLAGFSIGLCICWFLNRTFENVIFIVMFTTGLILLIYYCNFTLISVITNTLLTILLLGYGNRVYVNIQRFQRERDQAKESSESEIDQSKCVACMVSTREVLLRPCRHVCGCQECIERYIYFDDH